MSKQFKKFKSKVGKVALTLTLVGATAIGADAASKQMETTANLNMRTKGATGSAIVMTIPKGQKVNILEEGKSWNKVEYKGKQGYSYKRYLKEVSSTVANVELKVKTGSSNLNVRAGASTNFKVIGKLKNGAVVKASEKVNGWYKINNNGQVGYISADYVTVVNNNNGGGSNNGGSSTETPATGTMKNTASSLRIRKGAGTNTSTVGYLDRNEEVTVLAKTNNGWYKIKDKNGVVGYCSAKYLVKVENNNGGTETVKPMTGKVKVVGATNLNVRNGAGTGHKVMTTVKGGTVLEITGQHSNGWYQVKLADGRTGFISNKYAEVVKDEVKPQDQAPVITVERETVTLEQKDGLSRGGYISASPSMFGAKAMDKEDGDLTDKIEVIGNDNLGEVGSRELTLQVKDSFGNTTKKVVKLVVTEKEEVKPTPDPEPPVTPEEPSLPPVGDGSGDDNMGVKPEENKAPVINSVDSLTLEFGQAFNNDMLKMSAIDPEDGNVKVEVTGTVDTNKAGKYTLVLTAKDNANLSTTKTIIVTVKEKVEAPNQAPVLTVTNKTVKHMIGDNFNAEKAFGWSAIDAEDGNITDRVVLEGRYDITVEGTYALKAVVTDSKGAKAEENVTLVVEKKEVVNEAPTMTVANPVVTITEGGSFDKSAFGAVATDKEDGNLEISLVGNYDVNKPATYNLQIIARDSKGLEVKKDVQLVVEARKNNAPTITANSIAINQGDNFNYDMLGAKASDVDGDKVTITYEGTVDTNKPGSYTIKVIATDERGASNSVNVTVTVKEVSSENTNPNDAAFKNAVASQMNSLVNNHRQANGLQAFNIDQRLVQSANFWSKYMADNGVFDHVVNGSTAGDVCPSLDGANVGENIAMTQLRVTGDSQQDAINLANQIFTMFKNSSAHNSNMLSKWDSLFGFGFHAVELQDGVYTIWATQHFDMDFSRKLEKENAEAPVEDVTVEKEVQAPVVEEEVKEEVVTPEVEAPVVEEEVKEEVVTPEQPKEEVVVPEEQQPVVEMEDTIVEPTVEME